MEIELIYVDLVEWVLVLSMYKGIVKVGCVWIDWSVVRYNCWCVGDGFFGKWFFEGNYF